MTLSKIAHDLTATTMGIHALERARNDGHSLLDGEGLVPIYMGRDLVTPRSYSDWSRVRRDLAAIGEAVEGTRPGERRTFLQGMVRSLELAVRVFSGGSPTFEQKVMTLVGAPKGHLDAGTIEATRDRIDRLLARLGFGRGDMRGRVRAWEEDRAVPEDRIEAVALDLMRDAKARTADLILDTGDHAMAVRLVGDVPYAAKCDFHAGRVDINADLLSSRASLKHVVCHNVYPGHCTQVLYAHAEVMAGRSTLDALLVTANAVTGCVQEGIGDQGIYLIDWIEDEDDELAAELRSLRTAAQTSAAWAYMAEGRPAEDTTNFLRHTALGQEAWVRGRLRTAAHPFKGPFIASYWAGNEAVRRVRERVTDAQRPEFLRALFGRAHSPQSLEIFPAS